jgi:hypothetical protein
MTTHSHASDEVPVDWGKLLETQLERWQGGGSHGRGIAEYISNCDDSYRRLKKFHGKTIEVEIHSKRGRHIDKLVIRDFAEGMSYDNLENKFFKYFESASGRERGQPVTGRFGTGGKAYAIMNFESCWITSVKNGLENANHPTIVERRTKSENDPVFLEMVANYVLMVVSQYHAQKQFDAEPEEEKSDPILLFRQKFFKFQRELRQDSEISYFDDETEKEQKNSAGNGLLKKKPSIEEFI